MNVCNHAPLHQGYIVHHLCCGIVDSPFLSRCYAPSLAAYTAPPPAPIPSSFLGRAPAPTVATIEHWRRWCLLTSGGRVSSSGQERSDVTTLINAPHQYVMTPNAVATSSRLLCLQGLIDTCVSWLDGWMPVALNRIITAGRCQLCSVGP
jgi:hypothetical protein